MVTRSIRPEERAAYNQVVDHPLQSWEWGEFKRLHKVGVERLGIFEQGQLVKAFQVFFHQLPIGGFSVGYLPKGPMPDEQQLQLLRQLGSRHQALFIKLEPNVAEAVGVSSAHQAIKTFLADHDALPGRPLFTKHTFQIDLTQSEEKLAANLKSKTRYNIGLAQKKGVEIREQSDQEGMNVYLEILQETIKRQGFYAHNPEYFKTMWKALGQSGMMRIFQAVYQDQVLASWIVFIFDQVLYYPYGASRQVHRDVMASNLLMWGLIMFGKKSGCHTFDLWGSLGPEPDKKHPWYGFHRFKEGYGGQLTRFLGSYDLILNHPLYKLFRIAEDWRWKWLRLKARLPFASTTPYSTIR